MTVQISQGLLDVLGEASKVGPGERLTGRLEARLPGVQDEALDALAIAMTGDKSKRSVAAREVLAAGFAALRKEYGRQLAAQA